MTLLALVVGCTASLAAAADGKFSSRENKGVFAFAAEAKDTPFADDGTGTVAGWNTTSFRPNTTAPFHLYAYNPTKTKDTFIVELDAGFKVRATVEKMEEGKWTRVKFPAVAAPAPAAPAPTPAPVAAPAATPPTAPPELLPAGKEVGRTAAGFPITLRLLDKDGKPVLDAAENNAPYGRFLLVNLATPFGTNGYLTADKYTAKIEDKLLQLSLEVTQKTAADKLFGTSTLKLAFPKQTPTAPATRTGVYQRTLTRDPAAAAAPKLVLKGTAADFGTSLRADVSADGVDRALILVATPVAGSTGEWTPGVDGTKGVRVFPVAELTRSAVTKPGFYPVRVEVDNPPATATLELQVRRKADSAADDIEVIPLGGPRDERLWLDVTDAAVAVGNRSKDWVKAVNLTDARGDLVVSAVLKDSSLTANVVGTLDVKVDATPPEVTDFTFDNLIDDRDLEKGQPLKVSATGTDLDTSVAKAIFFIGKPGDDGKLPPEAVLVPGERKDQGGFTADLPIPADKLGKMTIGVILVDAAGNPSPATPKEIEIVPPAPKTGSIAGTVKFGDRPQPDVKVTLADGEGKLKGTTKTDEKGKFTFDKVLPGGYKLLVLKSDTTTGLIGLTEVNVEAGKDPTKAAIELKKNRPAR